MPCFFRHVLSAANPRPGPLPVVPLGDGAELLAALVELALVELELLEELPQAASAREAPIALSAASGRRLRRLAGC
jgi:hypothetical protein